MSAAGARLAMIHPQLDHIRIVREEHSSAVHLVLNHGIACGIPISHYMMWPNGEAGTVKDLTCSDCQAWYATYRLALDYDR